MFQVKDGFKFKTVENVEEYFNNPSNDTTSPYVYFYISNKIINLKYLNQM